MKPAEILKRGQKIIESGIKTEMRDQGHYLTGALERSLTAVVVGEEMEGRALDYANTLNDGIPADRIKIDIKSLAEMTRYVELRFGYKGGKAQRTALRILQKHKKEGNPTAASSRFSKTGERKKGLEIGFANAEPKLDRQVTTDIDSMMNIEFNRIKNETV